MFTCNVCGEVYADELLGIAHWELYHNTTPFRPSVIQFAARPDEALAIETIGDALQQRVHHFQIKNINKEEMVKFINNAKDLLKRKLQEEQQRLHFIKFGLILDATFVNLAEETSRRGFITKNRTVMEATDLDNVIEELLQEIILKVTEHEARGSGWSLLAANAIEARVHKHGYGDRGSSYIPLPSKIANTKACVNVQNTDSECFKYAMLTKHIPDNRTRVSKHHKTYSTKYNFNGMKYPVSVTDIKTFEKNNRNVSVNVFGVNDSNNVYPLKVVDRECTDHTDLLLLKKGDIAHYVYIENFNKLVSKQVAKRNGRIIVCKRCFCYKSANPHGSQWLLEHKKLCNQHTPIKVQLPSENRSTIRFTSTKQQYKIPIVIYADFEASLLSVEHTETDPILQTKYQKHETNRFVYYTNHL